MTSRKTGLGTIVRRLLKGSFEERARRRVRYMTPEAESLEMRAMMSAAAIAPLQAGTPSNLPSVADNNNTFATAINIGSLAVGQSSTSNGNVDSTNDVSDYYKVVLPAATRLRVYLSGMTGDADVQVLNSSGTVLASSTNYSSNNELLGKDLAAGTYFIRVYKPTSGSTNYTLRLTAYTQNDSTTSGAFYFDNYATSGTFFWNDSVSASDVNDHYSFTLDRTNHVLIKLTGLSSDADLKLFNSAGTQVNSSTNSGTASDVMNSLLSAGTYYIRVSKFGSGSTNYRLDGIIGDNTTSTATFRGSFSTTGTFSQNDNVAAGIDVNDYSSFTLTRSANVQIVLSGLSADADLQLLNSSGGVIGSSVLGGTASDRLGFVLGAGTYYIRVFKAGTTGSANYKLTTTIGDDTLATAIFFGTNVPAAGKAYTSDVGSGDAFDWYRFDITTARGISIALSGLSADADVFIYAANGTTLLGRGNKSGTQNELIRLNLAAGTYYVKVVPFGTARPNYTITHVATTGNWSTEIGRV